MSILKHELKVAKRNKTILALMFLDLDGFKNINDTYGHECGDLVLKEIAQRFSKCRSEERRVGKECSEPYTYRLFPSD